jgi:DNA-binding NarL/FixJ family response regulator
MRLSCPAPAVTRHVFIRAFTGVMAVALAMSISPLLGADGTSTVRGEVHLDAAVTRRLTRQMVSRDVGLAALTARERDILALVAEGRSNQQIAQALVISERTARTHVSHVLRKLNLTSRTQAALVAIREGLVPPPRPD